MKSGEIPALARNGESPISPDDLLGGRMLFVLLSLVSLSAVAAPSHVTPVVLGEVVAQGKRLDSDQRSAVVLTEEMLAREAGRPIGEVLRQSAGVDFNSGTGGNSNLLIRGSSGSQILVLIDGVKANDPTATNRYFDWSRIDTTEIERIEILKGPQAVSYGSDAIGGVVLITTKRGQTGFSAGAEMGSEGLVRLRTSYGMNLDSVHTLKFQALGKGVFKGGSSALSTNPSAALEGDNSREASIGAEVDSRFSDALHSKLQADFRTAYEDIDASAFDDDPNYTAKNREIRGSLSLDGKIPARSGLEWKSVLSQLDFRRTYSDLVDPVHPTTFSNSVYRGGNSRAEFQFHQASTKSVEWVAGVEGTRETLGIDSTPFPTVLTKTHAETVGVFSEASVPLDPARVFALDFGGRFSHFSSYGKQWSGKSGFTLQPNRDLTFDASISTGFKAPSLYSLYEPTYGNAALKPEQSVQIEAGFRVGFHQGSNFGVHAFRNRIRDRFGYNPVTFRSLNIARADIDGVEGELEQRLAPEFRITASVTYLSSHDRSTGLALTDVPTWKRGAKFIYEPSRDTSFTASMISKSSRGASAGAYRVSGFTRIDLASTHSLTQNLSMNARIENLLDRDYQEVRGYRTAGVSGYLGLEYQGF